jgi:RNA polymerase sigma factor for flagellar operon FliA
LNDTNSGQLLPFEELVADGGEPAGDDAQHRPFDQLLDEQQRQTLIEAIEALPEREKLLMALYYQEEMNLKEVGAVLGVTESRVSQLHSQAVSRLRARLHEHD